MNRYLRHGIALIVGILAVVTAAHLITGWQDRGGVVEDDGVVGSGMTGNVWFLNTSSQLQSAVSTWGIKIPSLASSNDCLITNASGVVTTAACGAGGSSKWTDATTFIYPTGGLYASAPKFVATSSVASEFPYASSTAITATNFWGTASLATALGANGANCTAGNSPLGVDASGAVESCFDVWTEAENTSASYLSSVDISANTNLSVTATGLTLSGDAIVLTAGYEIPTTTRMNVWDSKGNGTVTSVAMTVPTGLAISGSPITTTGTLALTLDTGYQIPTTTRMITWDTAYGWGNHASAGYLTGNQTITLSGDVTGSGATSITTAVADDSHAHTGTTLSGIDISADTNLSADGTEIVLTGDALSLGTALTFTNATSTTSFFSGLGTFTNSVISTLLTALNVTVTGLLDVGAGVLEIPNGTAPTVDAVGEFALDTTDNQLIVGTTTNAVAVIRTKDEIYKFSVPSTSPAFATGTTKYLPRISDGYVIDEVWCGVEGGTSKIINILGTNLTCTTGAGATAMPSITSIASGSSTVGYTASTTSGIVNWLNVTITGRWIRE